jgi:hypothetical protein
VTKPQGERIPGKPKPRLMDNIETHLKKTGCHRVKWIHLALDRREWRAIVSTVMNTDCDFHKP